MSHDPSEIVLSCENVHFRYFENSKKEILQGVETAFSAGSRTLIMGRSGSGKSTLAMLLAGLYPENGGFLSEGSIQLFGKEIGSYPLSDRAGLLTVMFQNPDLQFAMETLREEMIFCLENISCPAEQMEQRIKEAAERADMTDKLDQKLAFLSGGEKQKACLACIFLFRSKILILDEPFANLDNGWRDRLLREFEKMNREEGTTIIAIDHKAGYWLPYVDEIRILRNGEELLGGINRENIADFRTVFEAEDLAFPAEPELPAENTENKNAEPLLTIMEADIFAGKKKRQKKTDVHVLSGVNMKIYPGRMTAVVGPSGAGKTTLFRTLIGVKDYRGEIVFDGKALRNYKPKELYGKLGIVFQNPSNQFITQNVLAEVISGMPAAEQKAADADTKAKERLEAFRLGKYTKYSPYMLSQGQQRRLAVLGVMGGEQKMLILDEPTYGQDEAMTQLIMGLMQDEVRKGLAVVFSSHDIDVIRKWADDVYLVADGKVRAMGKEELYDGTTESLL